MKSLKIPRKVKKEIVKVGSKLQSAVRGKPQIIGVLLKPGVKRNKWTNKLINYIINEQKTFINLQSVNNNVSLSFALEAVQNDVQINALKKKLNDLYMYSTPKYVMQTNGEINAINSKEFDEAVAKILEQINLRRQQIMFAYNCQ